MDWNTLLSVVIGGLIATLGSILNNRLQSKERDKDRQEQRREAKIQLEEDLIRKAVKAIEDAIDQTLGDVIKYRELFLEVSSINYLEKKGKLSKEEAEKRRMSLWKPYEDLEVEKSNSIALRHAYSLGGEIVAEYRKYLDITEEFEKSFSLLKNIEDLDEKYFDEELYYKVLESAGNLQTMLREKLISVRDS